MTSSTYLYTEYTEYYSTLHLEFSSPGPNEKQIYCVLCSGPDHSTVCIIAVLTEEEVPGYWVVLWVVSWLKLPSDWPIV